MRNYFIIVVVVVVVVFYRHKLCGMLQCTNVDDIKYPIIGTHRSTYGHLSGSTLCKLVSDCFKEIYNFPSSSNNQSGTALNFLFYLVCYAHNEQTNKQKVKKDLCSCIFQSIQATGN